MSDALFPRQSPKARRLNALKGHATRRGKQFARTLVPMSERPKRIHRKGNPAGGKGIARVR